VVDGKAVRSSRVPAQGPDRHGTAWGSSWGHTTGGWSGSDDSRTTTISAKSNHDGVSMERCNRCSTLASIILLLGRCCGSSIVSHRARRPGPRVGGEEIASLREPPVRTTLPASSAASVAHASSLETGETCYQRIMDGRPGTSGTRFRV
jgi:hypothetical protein